MSNNLILRIVMAIVLIVHGATGMITGDINNFGKFFLDPAGFAPFGVLLAWLIKLSHLVCAGLLLANRFIKPAALVTIFILIMGIIMVHFRDGWFVVGGGRNGIEFNVVLIAILLHLIVTDRKTTAPASPTV